MGAGMGNSVVGIIGERSRETGAKAGAGSCINHSVLTKLQVCCLLSSWKLLNCKV